MKMEFDLDDGAESDDSFFEEPKVLAKRGSLTKTAEKKSVESLFGLSTDNVEKPKLSVTFDDTIKKVETGSGQKGKEDWLGDPDNVIEKHGRKTDLLDDILPVWSKPSKPPEKKVTTFDDILKESKVSSVKPPTPNKEVQNPPTRPSGGLGLLTAAPRERRRRGSSSGIEDALGLFGEDKVEKKDKPTAKVPEENQIKTTTERGVPDWLGAPLPTLNKSDTSFATKTTADATETKTDKRDNETKERSKSIAKTESASTLNPSTTSINPQQISMDIQSSYSSLHAQESFLLVSLQLKKYEEALDEIKEQQKDILAKQEKHFATILDEYILKQQMTENNVRLQQERINNQIQLLLTNSLTKSGGVVKHDAVEVPKEVKDKSDEMENLIKAIKERHNEEMFIVEESYKKQIDILEGSARAIEEKFREEMKSLTESFDDKLNVVKQNFNDELVFYKSKLKEAEEQHRDEIRLLKDNHNRVIEEMKLEHSAQIEYIKQMKQREVELLSGGTTYSEKLETSIDVLNTNAQVLRNLEEKISHSHGVLVEARESSVESKEKEIILMRSALEKSREAAEKERSQLMALVRNLELKLAEQRTDAAEDRWALQQASATLTARASAIEREAEYNRSVLEREREQLKTLKETLLAEQERSLMQLTEEKLQLQQERSRFETQSKLTNTYEMEKIKIEAESAIQTAKELTEKVNGERNYIQRQKSELDTLKRSLLEREREIEEKEVEMELLMQDAQTKLREDKKVLMEAKRMENVYKEKLQELQNQWVALKSKEKKISEEKVMLSKERLALYTQMKTNKSCALCKADESSTSEHFGLINQENVNKVQ